MHTMQSAQYNLYDTICIMIQSTQRYNLRNNILAKSQKGILPKCQPKAKKTYVKGYKDQLIKQMAKFIPQDTIL